MAPRPTLPERLNLKVDFIPAGASNRSGRPLTPTFITVHNTANAARGADARQRQVAWHFSVDDRQCVQSLPLHERGLHAGTGLGNASSLGIEICENAGLDQDAANGRAALLVAALLRRLGLGIA